MKPHKHAEVLIALAAGKEVQYAYNEKWFIDLADFQHSPDPLTNPELLWRVKPDQKPDIAKSFKLESHPLAGIRFSDCTDLPKNPGECWIKVIFDGETGRLKDVEVLE